METNSPQVFEVGGAIRDGILGIPTKDVDFSVAGVRDIDHLVDFVESEGHKVVHVRPEFFTVVAKVGTDHPLRERTKVADFVMCRRESSESDGRRPETVEPGTIFDDLARRDFTVNAIARDIRTGDLLDPHGGEADLRTRTLRFVGDPETRCREDHIRILRGLRFMVTKGLRPDRDTRDFLESETAAGLLASHDRNPVREEVHKMFVADTVGSMDLLSHEFPALMESIFRDGLHLEPTLKSRSR
jgi:tRNA nucleotidyltransferase/poly(A) polymerase